MLIMVFETFQYQVLVFLDGKNYRYRSRYLEFLIMNNVLNTTKLYFRAMRSSLLSLSTNKCGSCRLACNYNYFCEYSGIYLIF
jgi:hypothetical protein